MPASRVLDLRWAFAVLCVFALANLATGQAQPEKQTKIFTLVNADAETTAKVIRAFLESDSIVAADVRSNSLIAAGPTENLGEIGAILMKLDGLPSRKELASEDHIAGLRQQIEQLEKELEQLRASFGRRSQDEQRRFYYFDSARDAKPPAREPAENGGESTGQAKSRRQYWYYAKPSSSEADERNEVEPAESKQDEPPPRYRSVVPRRSTSTAPAADTGRGSETSESAPSGTSATKRDGSSTGARDIGILPEDSYATLLNMLADGNADVRFRAIQTLKAIDEPSDDTTVALVKILTDTHENVANAALLALARLVRQNRKNPLTDQPNRAAIDSLLELIHGDSESSVRERAIMALGRLGVVTPDAVKSLVKQLAEGDADARRAAAEALGQVGSFSDEAALALVNALADREDGIATAATRALRQITIDRRRWGPQVQARAPREESRQSR